MMMPKFNKILFAGALVALTFTVLPSFLLPHLTPTAQAQVLPESLVSQLNLTEAQREQIQAIRQDARSQIAALLTPEQRSIAIATLENGDSLRSIIDQLNLSDQQETEIRAVIRTHMEAASEVLTQEQRQTARRLILERRGE
jgi:periplasmic protein CpxP/Spy